MKDGGSVELECCFWDLGRQMQLLEAAYPVMKSKARDVREVESFIVASFFFVPFRKVGCIKVELGVAEVAAQREYLS